MATIKMFRGNTPPSLKKGEWASDGDYAYLGMGHGEYKVFQGVFEMRKDQMLAGFHYDLDNKGVIIPSGTPFSRLQRLFDSLPKALKYHTNEKASIDILFENGTFVNDLGTWLVLRDFSYQINLKSLSNTLDETVGTFEKPVIFQIDKAVQVYNSAVNFSDIRFEYSDSESGSLWFLNSTTRIDDCCFDAKVDQACVSDRGYNKIVFSDAYFKMNTNETNTILDKASVGSFINIARCKSDKDFRPKSIASSLEGGFIVAGNVEDLHIAEKSPLYMPNGGVEIHGGLVTNTDGGLNVAVPSKLSQLENDLGLTTDYGKLKNKPTTITTAQASAIGANSKKTSYPETDKKKLATIEENATAGATKKQSEAIAANSLKRSYPESDEKKLATIEENATTGATKEQSEAIEANSLKRSYPEADEKKLATIEENATAGATKKQADAIAANTKKMGYPKADADKLATIEEKSTAGADWKKDLKNKPDILDQIVTAFDNAGIVNLRYYQETDNLVLNFKDGIEKKYPNFLQVKKPEK